MTRPEEVTLHGPPGRPSCAEFASVFKSEFAYVWNTLIRLGIHPDDLEDITHEVFCQVYRQLGHFDRTRPVRPWLFGFAFRIASDFRRQARHRRELIGNGLEQPDPAPLPDDQLISAEQRALIETALQEVQVDRRAVLMLHEIDGYPIPQVAAALSIPLNTAYSRLRLARAELAEAVNRLQTERPLPCSMATLPVARPTP